MIPRCVCFLLGFPVWNCYLQGRTSFFGTATGFSWFPKRGKKRESWSYSLKTPLLTSIDILDVLDSFRFGASWNICTLQRFFCGWDSWTQYCELTTIFPLCTTCWHYPPCSYRKNGLKHLAWLLGHVQKRDQPKSTPNMDISMDLKECLISSHYPGISLLLLYSERY